MSGATAVQHQTQAKSIINMIFMIILFVLMFLWFKETSSSCEIGCTDLKWSVYGPKASEWAADVFQTPVTKANMSAYRLTLSTHCFCSAGFTGEDANSGGYGDGGDWVGLSLIVCLLVWAVCCSCCFCCHHNYLQGTKAIIAASSWKQHLLCFSTRMKMQRSGLRL